VVPAAPAPHHHPAAIGPTMKSGAELMETAMTKIVAIETAKPLVAEVIKSAEPVSDED